MRLLGVLLLLCAAASSAQERQVVPLVRVHGEATVSVAPDQAQFDIGVVTQASTAKAAANQNATQSDILVKQLTAGFPSAVIKTVNYSVNPNYRYPQNGAPIISGYTANNTVRILLNDLSRVQTVMDIAIKSGANSINRLQFSLQNENAARAKALGEAATQAKAGAEALASSLKLKLTRLLAVEEGQPVVVSRRARLVLKNFSPLILRQLFPARLMCMRM